MAIAKPAGCADTDRDTIRSYRCIRPYLSLVLQSVLFASFLLLPHRVSATPEYSLQTSRDCTWCHVDAVGGKLLTEQGKKFLAELHAKGVYRPLTTTQRVIRLIVGYFHMLAAIVWFGTIMYVHILLKPAYAARGLPRGELRLGWISMIVIIVTGTLLTVSRIPSFSAMFATRFGILLAIKIALFLVMLSSALIVTLFIGPKLRRQKSLPPVMENGMCTLEGLSRFDGKEGRPAYIAYKGTIYDVTKSRLWKNGSHIMKHAAGSDLTETLASAPHGEEKVLAMPVAGKLLPAEVMLKRPFHIRLFYFFAYMNLILVFVIVFVMALWRWW
jgi:predicted heme/steroid binding protein